MKKILTIVIPSYNVDRFLPSVIPTYCDERLLDDIEVLIVNDGSKDNTAKIADEFVERYPDTIRHIAKENGGHGSTINIGIENATGKYFKVIDGDDWVDTEALIKLVEKLKGIESDVVLTPYVRVYEAGDGTNIEETDVVSGSIDKESFTYETTGFDGVDYEKEYVISDILHKVNDAYQIHSTTFRTDIVRQIPKISENCFYVDAEYVIFPLKYAKTVVFYDYSVYQYRLGNANQSMAAKNLVKNRMMHEKVTRRIIVFATENKFTDNMEEFMNSRMRGLARNQMDIYLMMPDTKEGKKAWITFSKYLKKEVPQVYKTLAGKKAKLLRISNAFFGILSSRTKRKFGLK